MTRLEKILFKMYMDNHTGDDGAAVQKEIGEAVVEFYDEIIDGVREEIKLAAKIADPKYNPGAGYDPKTDDPRLASMRNKPPLIGVPDVAESMTVAERMFWKPK